MRKKYRRTGTVILSIFIVAVICVIAVVIFIYQHGLRYIKSDAGIKYFGNVDKYGDITDGRLWFEYDSATISPQKFYILELKDSQVAPDLPGYSTFSSVLPDDILSFLNESLPNELTVYFPMNNVVFNSSDDRVFFRHETFDTVIKNHESINNNYIKSGEVYDSDGVKWVMIPANTSVSSYKDFEIVQEDNKVKKYKGDIFSFLNDEQINYATFTLKDGNIINLYPARGIYRISYDKGSLAEDLYIGKINASFQKDGLGLYYHIKSGDIYYGDFINGEKTGWCQFLFDTKDIYEGYIDNGKPNGEGVFKWSDGSSYSGTFKDNMKNGRGVYIFSDGSFYEGDYVDDVKQGSGKYTFASGDVYEGEFENDLFNGSGKYFWASGDYYEGDFARSTLHGWGTFSWTSGRKYEGWWLEGKMVLDKPGDVKDIG